MKDHRIRVLLADDHTMFRQGLKEMLSTDETIEVVGEAGNGQDAIALAQRIMPDVVVLDVEMLAARGLSDRRIAALHISEATVKRHLANLYAKIRVNSRSEATRKALLEGWIAARDLTLAEQTPNAEDPQK